MPKTRKKETDNVETLNIELDFSAAKLWHFLNVNKNVTIAELEAHVDQIITTGLRALLPPDSVARLGIKLTLGRLKRQNKVAVFRDDETNEDRICLSHNANVQKKWQSALTISPNAL